MIDVTTPQALLKKMRSGQQFSFTAAEQQIVVGALAKSLGEKIAGDDTVPLADGPGRDPVKRTDGLSREQNFGAAQDDDGMDEDAFEGHAQEAMARLEDPDACPNGVPVDIKRKVAQFIDACRAQRGFGGREAEGPKVGVPAMDMALANMGVTAPDQFWSASFGTPIPDRAPRFSATVDANVERLFGAGALRQL